MRHKIKQNSSESLQARANGGRAKSDGDRGLFRRSGWGAMVGRQGHRAFPGVAIRQIEESLDRCHVGDAVCGGGDAQPRETTLTAGSAAFSCLRRHSGRDAAPRDAGVACTLDAGQAASALWLG